jgi:hypothetical protein
VWIPALSPGANRSLIATELADHLDPGSRVGPPDHHERRHGELHPPAIHVDEIRARALVLKGPQVPVVPRYLIGFAIRQRRVAFVVWGPTTQPEVSSAPGSQAACRHVET